MDWQTLFLKADGRIGKRDFWIGFAILFGVGFVAGLIPLIGGIIGLVLIYPQVCVYAKRLHDMGKSGWLILVPWAITVVCIIVAITMGGMAMMGASAAGGDSAAAMAGLGTLGLVMLVVLVINLGFLLWVGLSAGDPGENRFGPPPVSLTGGAASPPTIA